MFGFKKDKYEDNDRDEVITLNDLKFEIEYSKNEESDKKKKI